MYPNDPHDGCAWAQAHVDDYVDGTLPEDVAARFTEHCADCETCAVELELALAVRDGLESLQMIPCPEDVTDRVFERIATLDRRLIAGRRQRMMTLLKPAWRPVSIAAAAAAVVLMVMTVSIDRGTNPGPSQAEIDRAVLEAKYALAVINDAGRRAGAQVGVDVRNSIVAPVRQILVNNDDNGS
jgi:anti-sigma-K factor RskA